MIQLNWIIGLSQNRRYWVSLCLAVIVVLIYTGSLLAQDDTSPSSDDPATMITGEISADEVNEIARELWCPLCSGVRLDACELKACDQMKDEIAIKLEDGQDLDSIKTYFLDQYGPQVLGEPPREGFNLLAWILPIAVLIGGGVFLVMRGRKLFQRTEPTEALTAAGGGTPDDEGDPYADQLEKELKQYD